MKKKVVKKTENKNPKKRREEIFINVFAVIFFGGVLIWIITEIYNDAMSEKRMKDQYLASLPGFQDTISHSKVCMVDDFFQGDSPGIPVVVKNNTYYGCSREASEDLAKIDSFRFAIDPVSKNKVDKATAWIVIHPDKDGKVIYFGSKETYQKFLEAVKENRVHQQ